MQKLFILTLLLCPLFLPSNVVAIDATHTTSMATIHITSPEQNQTQTQQPSLTITTKRNFSQTLISSFSKIFANDKESLTLKSPSNKVVYEQELTRGTRNIKPNTPISEPGLYKLSLNDEDIAQFPWGVLVLNTDQDRYHPGDTAQLHLASLSQSGHTLCDSNLSLTINSQNIPIQKNSSCGKDNVTNEPDYSGSHTFTQAGNFLAVLTNLDTQYQVTQNILVEPSSPLTITRTGATRINPFKADYQMTLTILSSQTQTSHIKEELPPSFTALSPTTWDITLQANVPTTLTYTYRAPQLSPAIFNLGPLQVDTFAEARPWRLASDATFQMQTGYYIGDGVDNRTITGLGFQPDMVMIKDDTGNGDDGLIWKSSAMGGEVSAKLGDSEADLATDAIQSLDSDGFTIGTEADVNAANVRFTYVAFGGSDCSSSGTFCVGSYTGNGSTPRAITSVGFQPNFVTVKAASGTNSGVFRTSSMGANVAQVVAAANESVDGTRFQSLDATGFTIGNNAQVNTNAVTYWYFAFKNTTGAFAVGTFTGNATDNRAITGLGFQPSVVWLKNSNATTPAVAKFNTSETSGDYSGGFSDITNAVDMIQSLDSDGFTVGADASINENTKTMYWVAFAGSSAPSASGIFSMATGSYTGNGTTQSISSLSFRPDLVIIKHNDQATDQFAVFRTSLMKSDVTHYFANSASSFTTAITSIDASGFTLGSHATVNTSGDTYYWSAFGNAWNPETRTGAADFTVGSYTGNTLDNRSILGIPFQPNLVTIKRDTGSSSGFRTSEMSGDLTGFFTATAEGADWIQAIGATSFQIGAAVQVNSSAVLNHFFAFKNSNHFSVGTYTGNGTSQNITPGYAPELIWIKKATGGTARGAILRTAAQAGDASQPFLNSPTSTTNITALLSNGFSVGAGTVANENTFTYRYITWMNNVAPTTPSLDSPSDTATGQSLTPALLTTATDTSNDYLRYKIELCTNVGMTTGCQTFDQTSSQTGWSGQDTQTSTAYTSGTQATYTVQSSLASSTTYYWRSYAIDPAGRNSWSTTQGTPYSFTTLSTGSAPSTPSLDAPSNTATNQSAHPVFQTTASDVNSDYLRYKIELCTNVGMTTGCQTFDQTSSQTGWSGQDTQTSTAYTSGTQATYTTQAALSPETTYYWRSYAIDPAGNNSWSATQGSPYSFTTRSSFESFSCLIDETDDDSSLTISWSDRESAETSFKLEKNTDGGGFVAFQTLSANTTSYQDTSISQGHSYQYRVAPYFSSTGLYGDWCSTSTLSLESGKFQFENIIFR